EARLGTTERGGALSSGGETHLRGDLCRRQLPAAHVLFIEAPSGRAGGLSVRSGEVGRRYWTDVQVGFSTLHGVHHTNRPHRCHLCFRAFGNKAHLRRHLLSHTGEKPFGCPFCERRFSQACNAKVHVANVHSQAKTRSKPAFEYPGAVSFRYAPRSGNGQQRL
ncbi:unnamed protein product, partial [Ixodes persulcatus]